jgi:hypothetical protein
LLTLRDAIIHALYHRNSCSNRAENASHRLHEP